MEKRINRAKELFNKGYNCSQSVFVAFSALYGLDEETALKLSMPFGGGYAGTRDICGAVSAMAMIAGLETGTVKPKDKEGKQNCYNCTQMLMSKFTEEHGSILCKHLLGLEISATPINRKDCCEYVSFCARLVAENIISEE